MSRQSLVSRRLTVHSITAATTTLFVSATALALSALTQPLGAQTEPVLVKGARVRVVMPASETAQQERVTGTLLRLRGDTAVLSTSATRSDTAVFLLGDPAGRRLERSVASHNHETAGFLIGAILGGIVGGELGFDASKNVERNLVSVPLGVLGGGAAGGLIGWAIGSSMRTDAWTPVHTAGVRIALAPRGIGVGVTF